MSLKIENNRTTEGEVRIAITGKAETDDEQYFVSDVEGRFTKWGHVQLLADPPPAEPTVTLYCYTEDFGDERHWLSTPFNDLQAVLRDGGISIYNRRLISFQLSARLWEPVQPEAVEAVNVQELGHA